MSQMIKRPLIEMCEHYNWFGKPVCAKGRRAGLRCHSVRMDCPDYKPSSNKGKEKNG
jgi:hypothetical protein